MANITTRAGKGAPLTWAEADANFTNLNTGKLEVSNNLSDVSNPTAARSNLGLGNVDNTSDINKPISAATQAALNGKVATSSLSASSGSSLVGVSKPSGPAQTLQQQLDMLYYGVANIRDTQFAGGAKGTWNGSTGSDDTAAVQAAINSGARFIWAPPLPQGFSYQLTATIQMATPVSFIGSGVEIFKFSQGSRGAGSWFHINHTGIGFNLSDTGGTAARTGGRIEKIGTWRTQPSPGAGWAPTAHDWDIVVSNYDVILCDVVLFNPTKGVFHNKGNAGRLTIDGLYGQPLTEGITVEETYDVCRLNNVHFWPYWSDQADVRAWTLKNRRDISLKRCDNPLLSNIFTIFGQFPLVLTPSAAGGPSKVHLSNADFDRFGGSGILFEVMANSATLQGSNVTMQGETGYTTTGIQCNADSCIAAFSNVSINNVARQAVELLGTNNIFTLNGLEARDWNTSNTSLAAIYANTGCFVKIGTRPYFNDAYGTNVYSGSGKFEAPLVGAYAQTTTDASGNVTINHGARFVPTGVITQSYGGAAGMTSQITAISSTTFTVNFMNATGAALASSNVSFYWEAKLQ